MEWTSRVELEAFTVGALAASVFAAWASAMLASIAYKRGRIGYYVLAAGLIIAMAVLYAVLLFKGNRLARAEGFIGLACLSISVGVAASIIQIGRFRRRRRSSAAPRRTVALPGDILLCANNHYVADVMQSIRENEPIAPGSFRFRDRFHQHACPYCHTALFPPDVAPRFGNRFGWKAENPEAPLLETGIA